MKVLLTATPIAGHIEPILTVGRMLAEAGHEIVAMMPSAFRHKVERQGMRFAPPPREIDIDMTDTDAAFPQRRTLAAGPAQLRFDIETCFVDPMVHQHAGLQSILAAFPADAVMADMLCPGLLPLMLSDRRDRPVVASLGVTHLFWHRDDGAPRFPGFQPARTAEEATRYRAIAADIEAALLEPARARVDERLASCGAASLPCPWLDAIVALPDLYLQAAVPSFEYPRTDMPENVHFIGALPPPPDIAMPPAVAAALARGKRVVLVTQGTLANSDLSQLIGATLSALADRADIVVLATTGGRPVDALAGPVPDNAVIVPFLPFDAVMPRVDVLVTNGGYGTVTQALANGVPAVVAGATEDKPEVAARVAWAGAGIDLHTERPSREALSDAIAAVMEQPGYRDRARALGREFARFDSRAALLRLLGKLVEQQRTSRRLTTV